MSIIVKNGSRFQPMNIESTNDTLPNGVYHVNCDKTGYYLESINNFKLPAKIYGNDYKLVDRVLKHHDNTSKNTGVLLIGLKGTGKTITAQQLCNKYNKPVLVITGAYHDDHFKEFISNPCFKDVVVYIDEFEKIYNTTELQQSFLQLMDGALSNSNHNIYLFTCNEDRIDKYFLNRPGRIFYRKEYYSLNDEELTELANDLLEESKRKEFVETMSNLDFVTYDIAISVINEMKLFSEEAKVCVKYMALDSDDVCTYDVFEIYKGEEYQMRAIEVYPHNETIQGYLEDNNLMRYTTEGRLYTKEYDEWFDKLSDDVKRIPHQVLVNPEWNRLNDIVRLRQNHLYISNYSDRLVKVNKDYVLKISDDYQIVFKKRNKYSKPTSHVF